MISALRPSSIPDLPLATPIGASQSAGGAQTSFASVLAGIFGEASSALQNAEGLSAAGLRGEAPVQQVVEGLMNAERSLQVATTVRDKVVGAYQEFARMAI